jgi:hypothetical protein
VLTSRSRASARLLPDAAEESNYVLSCTACITLWVCTFLQEDIRRLSRAETWSQCLRFGQWRWQRHNADSVVEDNTVEDFVVEESVSDDNSYNPQTFESMSSDDLPRSEASEEQEFLTTNVIVVSHNRLRSRQNNLYLLSQQKHYRRKSCNWQLEK